MDVQCTLYIMYMIGVSVIYKNPMKSLNTFLNQQFVQFANSHSNIKRVETPVAEWTSLSDILTLYCIFPRYVNFTYDKKIKLNLKKY